MEAFLNVFLGQDGLRHRGARCHARPFAFCECAQDFSDVLGIVGAFEPSWQRWDCVRHGGTEESVLGTA